VKALSSNPSTGKKRKKGKTSYFIANCQKMATINTCVTVRVSDVPQRLCLCGQPGAMATMVGGRGTLRGGALWRK
jgi:hypothetical protein